MAHSQSDKDRDSKNQFQTDEGTVADTIDKYHHAPEPEDGSKPDSPVRLHASSWKYIFKRSIREFSRNKCTDLAASLTYFAMLSIFPGLLAMVSLLGLVGQAESTTKNMVSVLDRFASDQVVETLKQPIEQLSAAP